MNCAGGRDKSGPYQGGLKYIPYYIGEKLNADDHD